MSKKMITLIAFLVVAGGLIFFLVSHSSDEYYSAFKNELASVSDDGKVTLLKTISENNEVSSTSAYHEKGNWFLSLVKLLNKESSYPTRVLSFQYDKHEIIVIFKGELSYGSSASLPGSPGSKSAQFFTEVPLLRESGFISPTNSLTIYKYAANSYGTELWNGKPGLAFEYNWSDAQIEDYSGDNKKKLHFFTGTRLEDDLRSLINSISRIDPS